MFCQFPQKLPLQWPQDSVHLHAESVKTGEANFSSIAHSSRLIHVKKFTRLGMKGGLS